MCEFMSRTTRHGRIVSSFLVVMWAALGPSNAVAEVSIDPTVKARLESVLSKSGGTLTYFDGPAGMIGVGVSFMNGKQMVVYATADGSTLFSGVAIDVDSNVNLANADLQKLPPPDYSGVLSRLKSEEGSGRRGITTMSEGNADSDNEYFVFVDPTCGFCHKTYNNFLQVLSEGKDLVVHYIPVGIMGPNAENLAKAILSNGEQRGLEIYRQLARKEPYGTSGDDLSKGADAFDGNMSVFREIGFSGVPAIISRVGGEYRVRSGMVTAEAITQELQLASINRVAKVD